jgi:hypothetical protein
LGLGKRLEHDIANRRQLNEYAQSFLAPETAISAIVAALSPSADFVSMPPMEAQEGTHDAGLTITLRSGRAAYCRLKSYP